ncbi:MAG: hypothetical protein L0Z52_03295 [Acidobacteria bacterium]|nr:hypothetical protein [Acidobacteriota bacterium]
MKNLGILLRLAIFTIWFLALAVLASGVSLAADLNGFLREKGKGDVALSYTSESYDTFWAGTTEVDVPNGGDVDTESLSLWFAYGLSDRWTLTGDIPYVDAESDGFDMEQSALQDLTLLGEYRIATVGTKSRNDFIGVAGFRTHASNYDPNLPVDVGDGTTDALFRFVYQLTLRYFYFAQQIGFDWRNEDAPNGFPLYTETGYLGRRLTWTVNYWMLKAHGGTDIGNPGFTFPSNQEEYQRIGSKIYVRLTKQFGLAGVYYTTIDGRNTGNSSGFSAGIDFSF